PNVFCGDGAEVFDLDLTADGLAGSWNAGTEGELGDGEVGLGGIAQRDDLQRDGGSEFGAQVLDLAGLRPRGGLVVGEDRNIAPALERAKQIGGLADAIEQISAAGGGGGGGERAADQREIGGGLLHHPIGAIGGEEEGGGRTGGQLVQDLPTGGLGLGEAG